LKTTEKGYLKGKGAQVSGPYTAEPQPAKNGQGAGKTQEGKDWRDCRGV